jgi:hypothetical protein
MTKHILLITNPQTSNQDQLAQVNNPIGSGSEPKIPITIETLKLHTPHPEKLDKKKQPIPPNSNGASKSHKNPERKVTNFHLKSPHQNHNKKKNQQPNRFPNENPKLSTPTETKNKPKKRNPRENRKATTTEFEKGEAWESN